MKPISGYLCDHCGRFFKTERGVLNHENICNKNPVNDAQCFHCEHLTQDDADIDADVDIEGCGYFPTMQNVKILRCTKKNLHVITPRRQRLGYYEVVYDKTTNEEIPCYFMPCVGKCVFIDK